MSTSPSSQSELDFSSRPASVQEIDASLRWPVLYLFLAGAFWLVVGTALALIASWQLHSPDLFAGCSWLTHGKAKPAAWNALLYGFALQTAMGVVLYLICRLSRRSMRHSFTLYVAGKFWNLGVILGVLGIFIGDSTGHRFLEFPVYSTGVLLAALVFVALKGLMALHGRADREMYVSQWYAGAAILWLVWVLSTGIVLLQMRPVPGVIQLVVSGWYVNGLFQIVLGSVGLAALFYFLPQLVERPLYSRELAAIAFWLLMLVGGWTGLAGKWPLPAWIPSLSSAAGYLLLAPLLLVAVNLFMTVQLDFSRMWKNNSFRFLIVGGVFYILWSLRGVVYGLPIAHERLQFTHFETGQNYLFVFGFFAMVFAGVMASIGPRLAGIDCDCKAIGMVFLGLAGGVILTAVPLSIAGFLQGGVLNNGSLPFMDSVTWSLFMLKLATFGNLVLLVSTVMMLVGAGKLFLRAVSAKFPVQEWCVEVEPEGVNVEGGAK